MQDILNGVRQFMGEAYPKQRDRFEALASTQTPRVLFITCSDSRIVPHLLTGTSPGDLFVVRNAGNLVPPHAAEALGEQAAIAYAVNILHVKHAIVCGHSNCGALGALLNPESVASCPSVSAWIKLAQSSLDRVETRRGNGAPNDEFMALVEANVLEQLDNLRDHPAIADALATDAIELHGWVYDIGHGTIAAYDDTTKIFTSLGET